jgi:hypothetical protein
MAWRPMPAVSGGTKLNFNGVTVKRPKFGNGPLVRHPLSELLKNHISAGIEVRNLV